MISHEHRCIFVHIPKTAGNSINRVFGIGWQDHKDLQRYRDELSADTFAAYFKFAIVRNPWDRLLSDYNYQRKKSRPRDSKLFLYDDRGLRRNFAEWVDLVVGQPFHYDASAWGGDVSAHIHRWSPQVDWISADGRVAIDRIARLEHLPTEFGEICHQLALPATSLPHRNSRLHWHYSYYYDRTTRDRVSAFYARDVAAFGYEFEDGRLRVAFCWLRAAPGHADDNASAPRRSPPSARRAHSPAASGSRAPLALLGLTACLLGLSFVHAALPIGEVFESVGERIASAPHRVGTTLARPAPPLEHTRPVSRDWHVLFAPTAPTIVLVVSPPPVTRGGPSIDMVALRPQPRPRFFGWIRNFRNRPRD